MNYYIVFFDSKQKVVDISKHDSYDTMMEYVSIFQNRIDNKTVLNWDCLSAVSFQTWVGQ